MKSVKYITIALLAPIFVFLCSCGVLPQITGQASGTPSPAATETVPHQGGDLFIAMPASIDSFDPYSAVQEDLIDLLTLIYESPLKYDANGRLLNNLVETCGVDETKTLFVFKLRDNVFFSDGTTKLSADDIIYSAKKVYPDIDVLDADEAPPGEEDPYANMGSGGGSSLANGEYDNRYEQYNGYIASIKKTDDLTIEVRTNTPGNYGFHFMTFPVMSEALSGGDLPVGTGVYMAESYSPGSEMVLVRNPHWWREPAYFDKVVAKAAKNNSEELNFVETSIIDFATTDALYSNKYRHPGKTQVFDYMTNYYDCIVPNLIRDELKDVNVRQAISYAIDRREILSTVLLNHGVPTNLPIAPDFYAYEAKYKISDYDSNMARQLLNDSGYMTDENPDGRKLELTMIVPAERDAAYKTEAAKTIKKQLEEFGIELDVQELPRDEYLTLLKGGNYDLAYCSYYLDISPNLSFMFDEGGSGNYGHVQNAEISEAIKKCGEAVSEQETISAYEDLQRVLTERVPQIGLYYRMNSIICDESVQNIKNPRQNDVFANISEWYNAFFVETVTAPPASPAGEEQAPAAGTTSQAG